MQSNPIALKARTILLDWFDVCGNHIGEGSYISTRQTIQEIIEELLKLAQKGKHPGLQPMIPDGFQEYAITAVLRPLDRALGLISNETHKVPFDPEIPCRLINLFDRYSFEQLTDEIMNTLSHEKTYSSSN